MADIDENGFADLVVSSNAAVDAPSRLTQLFVMPRTNASTFGAPLIVESTTTSEFIAQALGNLAVGDFDGFGGIDVAVIRNSAQGVGELILRLNQGGALGTPSGPGRFTILTVLMRIDTVHAADLDRDGDPDLAFSARGVDGGWMDNERAAQFVSRSVGTSFDGGDIVATFAHDDDHDGASRSVLPPPKPAACAACTTVASTGARRRCRARRCSRRPTAIRSPVRSRS